MYRLRPGIKKNPEKRWALPDRVFFACGACHILAYAFLRRFPDRGFRALWIKPAAGFTGNHIIAIDEGGLAFDYHGWSRFDRLMAHMQAKACRWWPGWNSTLIELPAEVLISEARSRTYAGLWLREPLQFLHDAMPRAERFIDGKIRNSALDRIRTGQATSLVV
ncbi:hypothetical protein [Dongia sp. agr-C8]